MPRQAPVTNDLKVLLAIQDANSSAEMECMWSAKEVAEMLDLTPFQITARLAAMEKRGLMAREEGDWYITEAGHAYVENPPPPKKSIIPGQKVYRTPTGGMYTPGASVVYQEELDKGVERVPSCPGWKMKYQYAKKGFHQKMAEIEATIFIDTEGEQWIECRPDQKADLIVGPGPRTQGLPPKRLRRLRLEEQIH